MHQTLDAFVGNTRQCNRDPPELISVLLSGHVKEHKATRTNLRKADRQTPDTLAFLQRTPTRKRFPHFTLVECLNTLLDTRVLQTHRHAIHQQLKEGPETLALFHTHVSTRACPISKRSFSLIEGTFFRSVKQQTLIFFWELLAGLWDPFQELLV